MAHLLEAEGAWLTERVWEPDLPATLAEIDSFRAALAEHFITFDPGDLDDGKIVIEVTRDPETSA